MRLVRRTTFNTTTGGLAARLITGEPDYGRSLPRIVIDFALYYLCISLQWLWIGLQWTWRTLRIGDILSFILSVFLTILKWYCICMAIYFSVWIIWRVGYWGLPKLWEVSREIYRESRRRKLEEQWRNAEIKRQAGLRAKQAAKAAALKEAKLRKAREEQALRDKLRRDEEVRIAKSKADFMRWDKECGIAFQNKALMTKFPFPPLQRCTDLKCSAFIERPAPVCEHNVKQFLKNSGHFSLALLKRQQHRWHEDRFASCREDLKPEFRKHANSLFVILHPWYEELKEQQGRA